MSDQKNRYFKRGKEKAVVSVSLHVALRDAIEWLAFQTGRTKSDVVADILDQHFSGLVDSEEMPMPKIPKK